MTEFADIWLADCYSHFAYLLPCTISCHFHFSCPMTFNDLNKYHELPQYLSNFAAFNCCSWFWLHSHMPATLPFSLEFFDEKPLYGSFHSLSILSSTFKPFFVHLAFGWPSHQLFKRQVYITAKVHFLSPPYQAMVFQGATSF